jgi:hypothetical protein
MDDDTYIESKLIKCESKCIPVHTENESEINDGITMPDSTYNIWIFVRFDVDLVPA